MEILDIDDFEQFKQNFNFEDQRASVNSPELEILCQDNAEQYPPVDFWTRYFYYIELERRKEVKRKRLLARAEQISEISEESENVLKWDDVDIVETPIVEVTKSSDNIEESSEKLDEKQDQEDTKETVGDDWLEWN
eukprot:TRINITY_DN501_c0_g1_i2.p1 TRINITY_DN501_c0_g1~~TRINITY_DN501_c0_g1_i2.p1  ORF type:complete len:136 (+),score=44.50 TRINITY_DN501_c0_g1_i2:477-884(+)